MGATQRRRVFLRRDEMIIKQGVYKTKGGRRAVIARLKQHATDVGLIWAFSGAVVADNVYYIRHWCSDGTDLAGEDKYDLVSEEE